MTHINAVPDGMREIVSTELAKAADMRRFGTLLIVIADGEHVRFVRPGPDNVLRTARRFDSVAAHKRSADLRSDHPGASFHSDSTARHALAPRHDPHMMEKESFARSVAREVNGMTDDEAFDMLVLAAPMHCLAALHDELNAAANAKLFGMLSKDLTKVPDDALWPHLKDFVDPPSPARHK